MYKVGDKVVVRSISEIKATLGEGNMAEVDMGFYSHVNKLYFSPHMEWFCGKTFTISETKGPDDITLDGYNEWTFCRAWLKPEAIDNRRVDNV